MRTSDRRGVLTGGARGFVSFVGMLGLIVGLGALQSRPALAEVQNDAIGFSTNHVFESADAGEHIDVLSGNMTLSIPIGPRYKLNDNFGYGLTLYYNSKIWEHECPLGKPSATNQCPGTFPPSSTYGLGFSLIPGRVYHHSKDKSYVFRIQLEDGSEHFFCDTSMYDYAHDPAYTPNLPNCATGDGSQMYTTDTSHILIAHYFPPANPSAQGWQATMPDGRKIYFGQVLNTTTHESLATRIASPETRADLTPAAWVDYIYANATSYALDYILDSHGRRTEFTYTGLTYPYDSNDIAIDVPAYANSESLDTYAKARYVLRMGSAAIHDPSAGVTAAPSKPLLTEIRFPSPVNGADQAYKFDYDPPGSATRYGWLLKRTLPTGATVEYTYDTYETSDYRPYHAELIAKKLTSGGVPYNWTWHRFVNDQSYASQVFVTTNPYQVNVVDPFGNLTLYAFRYSFNQLGYNYDCTTVGECRNNWSDGLLSSVSTYAGPDAETSRLVRRVEYSWDSDMDPIPARSNSYGHAMFQYRQPNIVYMNSVHATALNARQIEQRAITPGDDGGPSHIVKVTQSSWSDLCPQQKDEYVDGALYRSTFTSASDAGCLFPLYVEVKDAAGNVVSRVDRKYKGARLECEVRWGGTGTPHAISDCTTLVSPNLQAGDVATTYGFTSDTWVTESSAVRGGDDGVNAPVSMEYLQYHRASDGQLENTGYLKKKTYGTFAWKAVDRTVDLNTGLTAQTHDSAGNTTRYTWDGLGRLTRIEPTLPEQPTVITYTNLRETHVRQDLASGNYVETVYLYDDMGRLITTKRRNATGTFDVQNTEYDIAGRVTRKSEWAPESAATSALKWTTYDYTSYTDPDAPVGTVATHPDPLGRIRGVTTPDDLTTQSPTTETAYAGNVTSVTVRDIRGWSGTAESNVTSTTVYTKDPLGRLTSVDSPGAGVDAQYTYDERDNLTEVRLTDPAAPTHVQIRHFDYDMLGRLRVASNPENGTVEYTSYDARGNLLSYKDARQNVFKMAYDLADRLLTRMQTVGGADLKLTENFYDSVAGFGSGASAGRLVQQDSYKIDINASTLVSRMKYVYGAADSSAACPVTAGVYTGLNGRLQSQLTSIQPWNADLQTDYCQDALGMATTTSYPTTAGSQRTRTIVASNYQNGYLSEFHDEGRAAQYISSLVYAPGGVPTLITRGNNQRDVIELDARNRPARFQTIGYSYPDPSAPGGGEGEASLPPGRYGPPLEEWLWCDCTLWDSGQYAYDMAGNVKTIGSEQYYYDAMSRLVHGSIPDVGKTYALDYGFDAFGNMTSQTRTASNNTFAPDGGTYTTDWQTNRLTQASAFAGTPVGYTYDENGNITKAGARGYVFDGQGRLREVMDPESGRIGNYDYDASGYRVRVEADGNETFLLRDASGQVLSEFQRSIGSTAAPVWNKDYIYALGKSWALVRNQAPSTPKRPSASSVTTSSLTLNWDPVPDPDILGYNIEVRLKTATAATEGVTNYSVTTETCCTFSSTYTTIHSGGYVKYTLTAVDTAGNLSAQGPQLQVYPFGTTAPPAPTGLVATAGDRAITLRWTPPTVTNNAIGGYFVERQNVAGGPFTRLNDFLLTVPEFLDDGLVNGQTYTYRAFTVDTSGRTSVASATASAVPRDDIPPGKLADVFAEPGRPVNTVVVSWSRGLDADVASYRVYRSTAAGTVGSQVATVSVVAGQASYSATDGGATQGTTYYYSVAAVDTSSNVSTASDQIAIRPRHSSVAVPSLSSSAFSINDMGTISTDGLPGNNVDASDYWAENDDVIQVTLTWSATTDSPANYRVYRKAPDETHFIVVGTPVAVAGTNTFNDTTVTKGDYTYYVTARKLIGSVWEESAAMAVGATADHPVRPFPAHVKVRNVVAVDGRYQFTTWNAASRHVSVRWSRVTEPDLVGYNVYRNCSFSAGCEWSFIDQAEHFNCEPVWVALNPMPLSPQTRSFEDATTEGMQGCFRYAVRAVGPNRTEGDIGKIVEADLIDYDGTNYRPNADLHAHHAGGMSNIPYPYPSVTSWPTPDWVYEPTMDVILDPPNGINGKARGTAAPDGAPPPPTSVSQAVAVKELDSNHEHTKFSQVAWTMTNPPSDLLGFHVETAGSPDGPWQRVTKHPVAWWERRYATQGVAIKRCDAYSGHTECLRYRVIAVDEAGNESTPVVASTTSTATCPATPPAPINLRAANVGSGTTCTTKLDWDPSSGAAEYYVYRWIINSTNHYFYDTKKVTGAATYTEPGDPGNVATCNPDTFCPYSNYSYTSTACQVGTLEAYYVTARGASGGESPRSNLVFWKCSESNGYAGLLKADAPTDAIAAMDATAHDETLACWVADGWRSASDADAIAAVGGATRPTTLATEPMVRLGVYVDPPWEFLDLHTDHLGSVRLVTSPSGGVVSVHNYFPFGEEITPTFSYNTHRYTGHEHDRETGLDYMKARYYGGGVTRFLSPDPVGGAVIRPQSWNRYAYVLGNPVKLFDPTGMYWAPGTTPPGGTAGPWGPCYMCVLVVDPTAPADWQATVYVDLAIARQSHRRIGKMIRRLEESKLVHTITPGEHEDSAALDKVGASDGNGSGSTIHYNPDLDHDVDGERTPVAGLVHELSHSEDFDAGRFSPIPSKDFSRAGETKAVQMENLYRAFAGDPIRSTYTRAYYLKITDIAPPPYIPPMW